MRVQQSTKTRGMWFAIDNSEKIAKVFFNKEKADSYIKKQKAKIKSLINKMKEGKK